MKNFLISKQEQEIIVEALKISLKNYRNNADIYDSITCKQKVILIESILKTFEEKEN